MSLLFSKEFTNELEGCLRVANQSVTICSAFIKNSALEWLKDRIKPSVRVKIISRWRKIDLIAGASDLEVYEICRDNNWEFGVDLNLHGKLYFIDSDEIFLGSANLTQRGLSLFSIGNTEFGTHLSADNTDIKKIKLFFEKVTWVDEILFTKLQNELKLVVKDSEIGEQSWSSGVTDLIVKPVEYLWVNELPFATPSELMSINLNDDNCIHDYELLGLDIDNLRKGPLVRSFKSTRLYLWLIHIIESNESVSFGALSSTLHNALLDDPKPYRKDVKEIVVNIFEWVEFIPKTFKITQHKHTKSISLLS